MIIIGRQSIDSVIRAMQKRQARIPVIDPHCGVKIIPPDDPFWNNPQQTDMQPSGKPGYLIVPGIQTPEAWQKLAEKHNAIAKKMVDEFYSEFYNNEEEHDGVSHQ